MPSMKYGRGDRAIHKATGKECEILVVGPFKKGDFISAFAFNSMPIEGVTSGDCDYIVMCGETPEDAGIAQCKENGLEPLPDGNQPAEEGWSLDKFIADNGSGGIH